MRSLTVKRDIRPATVLNFVREQEIVMGEYAGFVRIIERTSGRSISLVPMYQLRLNPRKRRVFDRLDRNQYGCFCGCSEENQYEIVTADQLFSDGERHSPDCDQYRRRLSKYLSGPTYKALALLDGPSPIKVSFSWERYASQRYEALVRRPVLKDLGASRLSLSAYIYLMHCLASDLLQSQRKWGNGPAIGQFKSCETLLKAYLAAYPLENDKGNQFSLTGDNLFNGNDEPGIRFLHCEVKKLFAGQSEKYVYAALRLPQEPVITLDRERMMEITKSGLDPKNRLYVAGFVKTEEVLPFTRRSYSRLTHTYRGENVEPFIRKRLLRSAFFNVDPLGFLIFPEEKVVETICAGRVYHTFYPTPQLADTGILMVDNGRIVTGQGGKYGKNRSEGYSGEDGC